MHLSVGCIHNGYAHNVRELRRSVGETGWNTNVSSATQFALHEYVPGLRLRFSFLLESASLSAEIMWAGRKKLKFATKMVTNLVTNGVTRSRSKTVTKKTACLEACVLSESFEAHQVLSSVSRYYFRYFLLQFVFRVCTLAHCDAEVVP